MKDVVFFTPNKGMERAAEFILRALNTGGPQRFSKADFKLIDQNEEKCAAVYGTNYKTGHESLIAVETVRLTAEEEPKFFLMVVVRTQSLRGSVKSSTMIEVPEKYPRFPEISDAWQEKVRQQLGHKTLQDVWNHLLNVEKISRMPL
jgi:hypothetical protein